MDCVLTGCYCCVPALEPLGRSRLDYVGLLSYQLDHDREWPNQDQYMVRDGDAPVQLVLYLIDPTVIGILELAARQVIGLRKKPGMLVLPTKGDILVTTV